MARFRRTAKWTPAKVMATFTGCLVIGMFLLVVGLPYLQQSAFNRIRPSDLPETSEAVDLSIKIQHKLYQDNINASSVYVYDANQAWIETVTSSSGVATFGSDYWEGETIYVQIRPAAPNAAAYYTYETPMMEYIVPEGDVNGDAQLPTYYCMLTSTAVATFSLFDQAMNSVTATAATNALNSTDTECRVAISCTTATSFGTPEDFTDQVTGKHYLSGAWILLWSNTSLTVQNADFAFTTPDYLYWVFRMDPIERDINGLYLTPTMFTIMASSSGFYASDSIFYVDIFDTCWADSVSTINVGSFLNGDSDLNPSEIDAEVDAA